MGIGTAVFILGWLGGAVLAAKKLSPMSRSTWEKHAINIALIYIFTWPLFIILTEVKPTEDATDAD